MEGEEAVGGGTASMQPVYSHWTSNSNGSADTRCEVACRASRLLRVSSSALGDRRARK